MSKKHGRPGGTHNTPAANDATGAAASPSVTAAESGLAFNDDGRSAAVAALHEALAQLDFLPGPDDPVATALRAIQMTIDEAIEQLSAIEAFGHDIDVVLKAHGIDAVATCSPVDAVATVLNKLTAESRERAEIIESLRADLAERDAALAERDAALVKAKATIKEKTVRAPKPRKVAPIEGERLDKTALRALLAGAEDVEVVFSDGEREVLALPAVAVSGDVWRDTALGLMLDREVLLKAPADREVGFAAFGLLVEGKVVAFHHRSDPLTVPPGGTLRLHNDIYF